MKMTPVQKSILLDLLNNNWEIVENMLFAKKDWIPYIKKITSSTLQNLVIKNIIEKVEGESYYKLTSFAKKHFSNYIWRKDNKYLKVGANDKAKRIKINQIVLEDETHLIDFKDIEKMFRFKYWIEIDAKKEFLIS